MGWFRSTPGDGDDAGPSYEERLTQISPGVPGHCPACDGLGYIDDIDIGHRYQIQHCKACLHRWEYLFDNEGSVVGLTELDEAGQPVTRSRVRPARTGPVLAEAAAPAPPVPVAVDGHDDEVVDVREGDEAPVLDLTAPEQLSPAEWLRTSLQR